MSCIPRLARLLLTASIAVTSVAACGGGNGTGPTDASAADNRRADEKLQGNWRIVDFKPETSLDPTMAGMLGFYQPTLVLQVQQGRIRALATSGTLHFDRRYEIKEALGIRFHLVVYDDAGVAQTNYCEFQQDGTLRVKTQTPWRGDALLARAP